MLPPIPREAGIAGRGLLSGVRGGGEGRGSIHVDSYLPIFRPSRYFFPTRSSIVDDDGASLLLSESRRGGRVRVLLVKLFVSINWL